jgi:beta-N-acetylhexosaminidase
MHTSTEALRRLVLSTLMPGFVGTTVPSWIEREYAAGLASVCLYGSNVIDPHQLSALCAQLRQVAPDIIVSVDEEGGDVTRLHYPTGSNQPGNALLGRLDDTALTRGSAVAIGRELTAYGINLDLAPVVDVNSADENPVIGVRSFGADAAHVARHSAAYIDGLQSTGVAACAKHFPGHGDTVTDSHLALPRVAAEAHVLDTRELEPFRSAVAAGVACIMTSHIVVAAIDPDRPATFSPAVLGDVLRGRLGFTGVIVSDALDMAGASAETGIPEAAVRALTAGCDLLCIGSDTTEEAFLEVVEAVMRAVDAGRLDVARIEEAATRVLALSAKYPADACRRSPADAGRPSPVPSTGDSGDADSSEGSHAQPPSEGRPSDETPWANGRLSAGFEASPTVGDWLDAPGEPCIVQVESTPNLAVGRVSWGPRAAGLAIAESDVPAGAKVAVAGRGLGAAHPAWSVADRLVAQGHPTIVVECGWPRGGADLVVYSGSLVVAHALGRYLGVAAR